MSIPVAGESGPAVRTTHLFGQRKTDRKPIITVVVALAIVVAGFVSAGIMLVRYASKFGSMDRTHESLSWEPNQGDAVSTTYANPKYGVTLKLPGRWEFSPTPTKYLCHLLSSDGFNAVFELDFPVLTPSVDSDAAMVARRYEGRDGWTLDSEESLEVSGLPAHVLRTTSPRKIGINVLLVKKWPLVYGLDVAGPADAADEWQRLRAALPQSIEIK
ncbi:MAG: hypothetical protein ABSG27_03690 [Candidatus Acidiferrales bacterium]|jgi:hypothetical protein